jgi:hypothetical protein
VGLPGVIELDNIGLIPVCGTLVNGAEHVAFDIEKNKDASRKGAWNPGIPDIEPGSAIEKDPRWRILLIQASVPVCWAVGSIARGIVVTGKRR